MRAIDVPTRRGAWEGIGSGLIAGAIFAVMQMAASVLMGDAPLQPIHRFASVLLGPGALETAPLGTVLAVGLVVHLAESAVFGLVYGLVNAWFSASTQTSFGRQLALGGTYGAALWLLNYQFIARLIYPWFLEAPQVLHLGMHALFYGMPLALFYTGAERRSHHSHGTPRAA